MRQHEAPDFKHEIYRRHYQGAWVRSLASLFLWSFAFLAFLIDVIKTRHLAGISLSVLFIILINPPTLYLMRKATSLSSQKYISLLINFLEVIGYTGVIYSLGGTEATYLIPIYIALISYVGMVAPKNFPFIVAVMCSIAFGFVVLGEIMGFLSPLKVVESYVLPVKNRIIFSLVVISLLFVIAYISSTSAGIIREQRKDLKLQNEELKIRTIELEKAKESLRKANEDLEKKVMERTKEISQANEKLLQEIEERKKVEENFRLLFEHVLDVVYTINTELIVTSVTPSVEKSLGYTPQELIGKHVSEVNVLEPSCFERAISDIFKVLSGERVYSTYEFLTKDGQKKIGHVSGSPIYREGKLVGMICVARDITDQVNAERERERLRADLQRAQKMEAIGLLAGGVAHDLNNVLTGIVSYPDLLLMKLPEDSPARKYVKNIKEAGERAALIVQDLLTMARRGTVSYEVVNLNSVVSKFMESLELKAFLSSHPNVKLKTALEQDLLNIEGSPLHLSKALMNLVSNAMEAMPEGGTLLLATANRYLERPLMGYERIEAGEYVVLEVSDSGVGISKEDLQRIFEPFYTKKVMGRRSGTGLGMTIIWAAVKDHGGYIDVVSEEGKGTTFTLYFPVTRKETEDKPDLKKDRFPRGKGESILVVDDMEDQRRIAHAILSHLGYSVSTVASGEEAIEFISMNPVDLVLLDMILEPGMDGLETYKRILEVFPGQKAILVTGFADTEKVKEAIKLGVGTCVRKPYTIESIAYAVRAELDKT